MVTIAKRYINPFTDFGFKKLFGEEENKDLLIDFLNELLKEYGVQIAQLTYLKTEKLGFTEADRRAVYDLYCEDENGEKFIVELQRAKQEHFKDRSIYYATFPIQEQAKKGKWNYELKGVYFVAIMDFVFDESSSNNGEIIHHIQLMNTKTHEVFYDKLHFTYVEIQRFGKELHELHTRFDKWLYVLRNLPSLDDVPDEIVENVFQKLFKVAEIAKFNARQRQNYRNSEKIYNDFVNSLDTYFKEGYTEGAKQGLEKGLQEGLEKGLQEGLEKGLQEGLEKGKKEALLMTARNLKLVGLSTDLIVQATGLSVEEIEQL